jgi:hypothetical protein
VKNVQRISFHYQGLREKQRKEHGRSLNGRKPVLPTEIEEELVRYCLVIEHKYYGLCAKDVKRMAYSLAIRNGARYPFSREKEKAGRK